MILIPGPRSGDRRHLQEREHHDPRGAEPVQLRVLHVGLVHRLADLLGHNEQREGLHSGGQSADYGRGRRSGARGHQEV